MPNQAPVADDLTIDDFEDTPHIFVVLTASDVDDSDGSGDPPTFRLSSLPGHGILYTDFPGAGGTPVLADTDYPADFFDVGAWKKVFFFIPDPSWSGTTDFDIVVTDSDGGASAPATVMLNIAPVADAPVVDANVNDQPDAEGLAQNVTGTNGGEDGPALAALNDGRSIMVWETGPFPSSIRARIYDANGAPEGASFAVTASNGPNELHPAVAGRPDGGFAIAWVQDGAGTGGGDVYTAFYAPGSTSPTLVVAIAAGATGWEADPILTAAGDGYVVTWAVENAGGADYYAQRYTAAGAATGPAILVSAGGDPGPNAGAFFDPPDHVVTAIDADGSFLTVTSHGGLLEAVVIDSNGNLGTPFAVGSGGGSTPAAAAALPQGGFVIAWTGGDGDDVLAQVFDSDGNPVSGELPIAVSGFSAVNPQIGALPDGRFVIAWVDNQGADQSRDIFAQIFSADGELASGGPVHVTSTGLSNGPPFPLPIDEIQPTIAVLSDGRFTLGWMQNHANGGTNNDVFVRTYDPGIGIVEGHAGVPLPLPTTFSLTDTDGSEVLLLVRIEDLPAGFTLAVGGREGGDPAGAWVIDRSTGAGATFLDALAAGTEHLSITAPGGYAGSATLEIIATSQESGDPGQIADSEIALVPILIDPNAAPILAGFGPAAGFAENDVNAVPALLDSDVVFTDADDNLDGGHLTVSGLLAEDRVAIRNQGAGAGEIGVSGSNVTYGGVVIGSFSGGVGATLTVTLNAAATSAAVDALIQNLTYADVSDTPAAERALLLNVTDADGADLGPHGAASFSELVGAANPLNGVDVGTGSKPGFVDLDGDGDMDVVVGDLNGILRAFRNDGGAFTALTGAANPFDGVDVGYDSSPAFIDLDGDGDMDAVVGEHNGTLRAFRNDGGIFTELTGALNPFNGLDMGFSATPSFADLDGDGDMDAVIGTNVGATLRAFRNDGGVFAELTGAANPFDGAAPGNLARSAPAFIDFDGDGDPDLMVGYAGLVELRPFRNNGDGSFTLLTDADSPFAGFAGSAHPAFADFDGDGDADALIGLPDGTLRAFANDPLHGQAVLVRVTAQNDAPVAVDDSLAATEDQARTFTAAQIVGNDGDADGDALVIQSVTGGAGGTVVLNGDGSVTFTSPVNFNGPASFTYVASDGHGGIDEGAVTVQVRAVEDGPVLSGFGPSATFAENEVNAAPMLLDGDVTITDPESNIGGGALTVSGLLAEDRVTVRDQGTGAGQIGVSGSNLLYGGTIIGSFTGGTGATFTVHLNAAATSAAVEALIENLTYADVSDTPVASRALVLNVTDAAGAELGAPFTAGFSELAGAANPFNGVDVGTGSSPAFVDLDGDGDMDALVGNDLGTLSTFRNDGGAFTELTGAANPFDGVDVGSRARPSFVDLDGDGDMDAVVGETNGTLRAFRNDGGAFTELTGAANPFNGVDVGSRAVPSFVDLDGDGDLDAVVGKASGTLSTFRNEGNGSFTALTGAANPFDGVNTGSSASPTFVDLDSDGNMDMVVGQANGTLRAFRNKGGAFTELTGAANPFDGADLGSFSAPGFADLDGDGDPDAIVGIDDGTLRAFANTIPHGQTILVKVTAQNDAPAAVDDLVSVADDRPTTLTAAQLVGNDSDADGDALVIESVAGAIGGSVALNGNGTVTFTPDASFSGPASFTYVVSDGHGGTDEGAVTVNFAPRLTGLATEATFAEGDVNTVPALLDSDVVFTDAEGNLDGGHLTVSGLLAEDQVSIRDEGTGPGQIHVAGTDVLYDSVIIGSFSGGVGATLTVTLNAAATSAAVDALIQNLTFADVSDTPTAERTLLLNLTDAAGADLGPHGAARFTELGGAANPFGGVDVGRAAVPGFADLDGDGDLDALVGTFYGTLRSFRNDGGAFAELTGAANPFDGVDVGWEAAPAFIDLDGDGDMDAVVGEQYGTLRSFRNDGGVFTELTGALNPFDGVDMGFNAAPSFIDLDGDGDMDAVVGANNGTLRSFRNDGGTFTELTGAANPFDGFVLHDGANAAPAFIDLDGDGDGDLMVGNNIMLLRSYRNDGNGSFTALADADNPLAAITQVQAMRPAFADFDGDGDADALIGGGDGTIRVYANDPLHGHAVLVTVTARNDAPVAIDDSLAATEDQARTFTAALLVGNDGDGDGDALVIQSVTAGAGGGVVLNGDGSVTFTPAANHSGPAWFTYVVSDGHGGTDEGAVTINVRAVEDGPVLSGFSPSATFAENEVNAAPMLLDGDVTIADPENNIGGGAVTVSGLLAEDRVAVRDQGMGAGEIGVSGADVTYGGIIIGSFAGGVGATFTVTLNAAATSAAVEALIENLTYADVSDTPVASRTLVLNVTDATGAELGAPFAATFSELAGAANPFAGVDVGTRAAPGFTDLDGDGDMDAVVGATDGQLRAFRNDGGAFTALTGTANPFNGVDVGSGSSPGFVDLDGDGDMDAVVGENNGTLRAFRNDGGAFTALTGAANPFSGVDVGSRSRPGFADLDGDGDMDAVVGKTYGTLSTFRNEGNGTFTELTGAANPFDGVDTGSSATPAFVDLDGDGDRDMVLGQADGTLRAFRNDGDAFTELTGAANPFNGVDLGSFAVPGFADIDGDGDPDAIVGNEDGTLLTFNNNTPHGQTIIVNVSHAPVASLPAILTGFEDEPILFAGGVVLDPPPTWVSDVDSATISVRLTVTDGRLSPFALGSAVVTGNNSNDITITGAVADVNRAVYTMTYTPAPNANGTRTITVTTSDGVLSDVDTISVTIQAVSDAPSGADLIRSTNEGERYQLHAGDFGFSDPADGNALLSVDLMTVPTHGRLTNVHGFLDNVDLTGDGVPDLVVAKFVYDSGDSIDAADLQAGYVYYQPDSGVSGPAADSFTFNVRDDGGTAMGGANIDSDANILTFDVNARPVVDLDTGLGGNNYAASYTENGPATPIGATIAVTDADAGDQIDHATVTLTNAQPGDVLGYGTLPGGISAAVTMPAGKIVITLSGAATPADYAAAIAAITYANSGENPASVDRTVEVLVNDGAADSAPATATINVIGTDDPAVAKNDAVATDEATLLNGSVFADNGSGVDGDVDGPSIVVSAVNGSGANVGVPITLASGAHLTLGANGNFSYDPTPAFNLTPAPGSGASNTPAHDSFTYTLTGGNTATVTVTVTGIDTNDLLIGTAGADTLDGGTGNDILRGLGGDDVYYVDTVGDNVREAIGAGSDRIYASADYTLRDGQEIEILSTTDDGGSTALALGGNEFDNLIIGNGGVNILYGKGGNDILRGLGGNDVYYVDTVGDNVREAVGGGFDRIYASADYTLRAGQEIEVLSTDWNDGTTNLALGGNEFANSIYGNNGANILDGKGGYDILIGLGGNDVYYVDSVGDNVVENIGGGNDRIYASADYTLRDGQEIEVLSTDWNDGTTNLALGGNELNNSIYGNAGNNILDGKGGNDILIGLGGDDNYYVDTVGDTVGEAIGGGNDRVYASADYTLRAGQEIEVLSTDWNDGTTNLALGGNEFDNSIYGNNGNNILYGKGGNDILAGLGGADQFWFIDAPAAGNVDTILDFQAGVDEIVLLQGQFGNMPAGTLGANAFQAGNGIAQDADDRILYDTATGALYFDADGNGIGAAVHFATLSGAPAITVNDFQVI